MSIKTGDIFKLGEHYLLCGDSTNNELLARFIADRKIKALVCDPPYGVSYVEKQTAFKNASNHSPIANDNITSESDYYNFSLGWLMAIRIHFAEKNAVYIFSADTMLFSLHRAMKDSGMHFGQLLVWVKNNSVLGRLDYLSQHELIIYGWHGTHEFMKAKDKSILFCPKPTKSKLHPTMKPISLLRRLILNSTQIGDYVCDPFLGSGSTLIACEQTRRKCLGIELDPKYCEVIINRFEKVTGVKGEKIL